MPGGTDGSRGQWPGPGDSGRHIPARVERGTRRARVPAPGARSVAGSAQAAWAAGGCRHSLEHGDEQVEQQDVGEEQVQAEQEDRQPLGEDGLVPRGVALRALGLVRVGAVGAAVVRAELHA